LVIYVLTVSITPILMPFLCIKSFLICEIRQV
jgi:hypothetical protein